MGKKLDEEIIPIFNMINENRKFEIELFWKRSLFFWGFIIASFYAYITLAKENMIFSLMAACLGFACSVCWTCVNRGSKYWQEQWEAKLKEFQGMDDLYEPKEIKEGEFWSYRFSVSKLLICLSDFITILWFILVLFSLYKIVVHNSIYKIKMSLIAINWLHDIVRIHVSIIFILFTLLWMILFVYLSTYHADKH